MSRNRTIPRFALPLLLAWAFAARIALCWAGGQYFFGDEGRYDRGIALYQSLRHADRAGIRAVLALPEHALFPWIGAAVTAAQHALAQATPYGDWTHPENIGFTIRIGAAVLSCFSTLAILLTYRVARAAGGGEAEALWAAALMAASDVAFYYARHLLPYDCALCAALEALAVGLAAPGAARAALAGLLAGVAYHLYNGYWFLVPVIGLILGLAWRERPRRGALALAAASGAVAGLGVPLLVGAAAGGAAFFFSTMGAFSRSAVQGWFAEGGSLPWAYLWHAEGPYGVAVAVLGAGTLAAAARGGRPPGRRPFLWATGIAASYALLVLFSVVLHRFVVYARTVKPLVPFFCLLGGWALHRLFDRNEGSAANDAGRPSRPRGVVLAAVCALGAVGALHLVFHLRETFPRDVEIAVLRTFGNPKHTLTVAGSLYQPLSQPVTRPDLALVNAQFLYPVRALLDPPAGRTLLRIRHPLAYLPYQYEGHTPRERELLRKADLSIRLIALDHPGAVPDDLPPDLRYRNSDRPTGR